MSCASGSPTAAAEPAAGAAPRPTESAASSCGPSATWSRPSRADGAEADAEGQAEPVLSCAVEQRARRRRRSAPTGTTYRADARPARRDRRRCPRPRSPRHGRRRPSPSEDAERRRRRGRSRSSRCGSSAPRTAPLAGVARRAAVLLAGVGSACRGPCRGGTRAGRAAWLPPRRGVAAAAAGAPDGRPTGAPVVRQQLAGRRPATELEQGRRGRPASRSGLHDHGHDHRPAAGALVDELPGGPAHVALERLDVAARRSRSASSTASATRSQRLVEQVLGLGGVHPAAGDDLGPGEHLAGLDVDGRRRPRPRPPRPAPGGRGARPGRRRRRCRRRTGSRPAPGRPRRAPSSVSVDRRRRPRTGARGRRARPSAWPAGRGRTRWRYSPWTGTNHSGLGDRQERLELVGLGVAGGVHVGDPGVHDLGAERAAGRRSPC